MASSPEERDDPGKLDLPRLRTSLIWSEVGEDLERTLSLPVGRQIVPCCYLCTSPFHPVARQSSVQRKEFENECTDIDLLLKLRSTLEIFLPTPGCRPQRGVGIGPGVIQPSSPWVDLRSKPGGDS